MMHPSCLMRVEEYIKDKDEEVRKVIRNLCVTSSTNLRIPDLKKTCNPITDKAPEKCRIALLVFDNFRTYPDGDDNYGLSFLDSQSKISSLLLVGQNGSGKSTLYTALEKIYMGYSSYSKLLSSDPDSYLSFGFKKGTYGGNGIWKLSYSLEGEELKKQINQDTPECSPLTVPAFFCSDVDIHEMKNDGVLFFWILKQMGYGRLNESYQLIGELIIQLKEKLEKVNQGVVFSESECKDLQEALLLYDKDKDSKEVEDNSQKLTEVSSYHRLFEKRWSELTDIPSKTETEENVIIPGVTEDDINEKSKNRLEEKRQKLVGLYCALYNIVKDMTNTGQKLNELNQLFDNQKEMNNLQAIGLKNVDKDSIATNIKLLEDVEQVLNELRIQLVKQFILEYGDIVSHIMSYFSNHGEEYTFNSVDDIEHIKLEIHANLKSEYVTTPHEYFNEFRFKLYCVAMKMAISFYWILQHRISAPIVIDDVFNANDFENSIKLEQFAYFMKKAYNEHVLLKGFDRSLQLIMMTHDDLVLQSFKRGYTGLNYADIGTMKIDQFPLVTGRLYRLEEIDEIYKDSKEAEMLKKKNSYKSIYQNV